MVTLNNAQQADCNDFYELPMWYSVRARYAELDDALLQRYISALAKDLSARDTALRELPAPVQQQIAIRTMLAATQYKRPNQQTFISWLIEPVHWLLSLVSDEQPAEVGAAGQIVDSNDSLIAYLDAVGANLGLKFNEQLSVIQVALESHRNPLSPRPGLTNEQLKDQLAVNYFDAVQRYQREVQASFACFEQTCPLLREGLSDGQSQRFNLLFKAVVDLAYNEKCSLSRQKDGKGVFQYPAVFQAILKAAKSQEESQSIQRVATEIYDNLKTMSALATEKNRMQYRAARVDDPALHVSLDLRVQMTGGDVCRALPKDTAGVQVMSPQYQNNAAMRLQLLEPVDDGPSALVAALSDSATRYIVIPVGPGHWQGIYISKPPLAGEPYQIELYDPYGKAKAVNSLVLKKFAEDLLAGCGIDVSKNSAQVRWHFAEPELKYLQYDGYACGDFTVAYTHLKFQQWGLPTDTFDAERIKMFQRYGNRADLLRHYSRVKSARLFQKETSRRKDLTDDEQMARLLQHGIPEASLYAVKNPALHVQAAIPQQAASFGPQFTRTPLSFVSRRSTTPRVFPSPGGVASVCPGDALGFFSLASLRGADDDWRGDDDVLSEAESEDVAQYLEDRKVLLLARPDVAAVVATIARLRQPAEEGYQKAHQIDLALRDFIQDALERKNNKSCPPVSSDARLMAALAERRNVWDPRVWLGMRTQAAFDVAQAQSPNVFSPQ